MRSQKRGPYQRKENKPLDYWQFFHIRSHRFHQNKGRFKYRVTSLKPKSEQCGYLHDSYGDIPPAFNVKYCYDHTTAF